MKNLQTQLSVFLLLFTGFALSEVFEIKRSIPDGNNGWTKGTDSFKVSSICDPGGTHSSEFCETFNASKTVGDQCSCSCPSDRATFTFDKRTCLDNTNVRNDLLRECGNAIVYFSKENRNEGLRMLVIGDNKKLGLSGLTCKENVASSWYLGCNGTKHPLSTNTTTESMFTVTRDNKQSSTRYNLKVNQGSNTDLLRGRIINVGIRCPIFIGNVTSFILEWCLLFKFEGTTTCPEEEPSSSTIAVPTSSTKPAVVTVPSIHPSTQTVLIVAASSVIAFITEPPATTTSQPPRNTEIQPTATLVVLTPSSKLYVVAVQSIVTSTQTVSTIAASSVKTFITEPPATPTNQPPINTKIQPTATVNPQTDFSATVTNKPTGEGPLAIDRPSSGRDQQKGDSGSSPSLGLILGVTVSALALALFINGYFMYRRHKSSQNHHKGSGTHDAQGTVMMSPQANSTFQPDVMQTGYASIGFREPTYATTYNVPKQPAGTNTATSYQMKNGYSEETPNSDHLYAAVKGPEAVYSSLNEPRQPLSDSTGEYENSSTRHESPQHSGPLYAALNSSKGPHIYGPGKAQKPAYDNVPEGTPSGGSGQHRKDHVYDNVSEAPIPHMSGGSNYGLGSADEPV